MSELSELLGRIVQLLDDAGVPFMIAGSFASTAHGIPRTTQDVDIVIDPPDAQSLDTLVASMSPSAYYVDADAARDAFKRRSMFNVIDQASGWKVDFILRKHRSREPHPAALCGKNDKTRASPLLDDGASHLSLATKSKRALRRFS